MEYLHHKVRYIHRDLKPQNILIDENLKCILSDFSLSIEETQGLISLGKLGTPKYMAPEAYKSHSRYTKLIDVFSFAITCWEILTEREAYESEIEKDGWELVLKQVVENGKRPLWLEEDLASLEMRQLLDNCWQSNFEKRPNFMTIKKRLTSLTDKQRENFSPLFVE